MESSWRRSTLITLILAATMVVGLAGTAWADVSNITLTSPSSMVYVKAGDVITISGAITASSNGDSFWVNAAIGSGGKWYEKGWEDVGPVPGQSPYRSSYEVSYAVPGSVPEGTYRIRVQGRQ